MYMYKLSVSICLIPQMAYQSVSCVFACTEHRRGQLQNELEAMQSKEMQLSAIKQGLEEELKCSKSELETCQNHLETSQLELSKTKVYNHTLDKRNKVN